jgi:hypothetical protein
MDVAHGWNRWCTGVYHEGVGAAKYLWNGGDHPSVDDDDSMRGRMEGGDEYQEGENWSASGRGLMNQGVRGMGRSIWDGITGGDSGACWADGQDDPGASYDEGSTYDGDSSDDDLDDWAGGGESSSDDVYDGMY